MSAQAAAATVLEDEEETFGPLPIARLEVSVRVV